MLCAFDRADLIICVGYDMVEYHPHPWNPENRHNIIHFSAIPAEVDEHYTVALEVQGHVGSALRSVAELVQAERDVSLGKTARCDCQGDDRSMPTISRFR